jgi:hypothetical protein
MPFEDSLIAFTESFPEGTVGRVVMEYLSEHAVGRANAKPWSAIESHIISEGYDLTHGGFQQGILKRSRDKNQLNKLFIGSNDHGDCRGYYIITEAEDAYVMHRWYAGRLKKEQARVRYLESLIQEAGWPLEPDDEDA